MKEKTIKNYLISFPLFFLSLIMIMPFLIMVSTSLKGIAEINSGTISLIPKKWMFSNYAEAMRTGMWLRWIFNSVFVSSTVTAISLLFNSLSGFAIARLDFRGRKLIFITLLMGLMVPPQITMVPVFMIMKQFPLFGGNNILGQGGPGLIDSYLGLMINRLSGSFGIFLCRQYYLNFPSSLDDAAAIDGSSIIRSYFYIYVPLSGPLFASLGVIKLTNTWNDYIWPLIITNSEKLRTVQLALAIFKDEFVQWDLLMAAATVITTPLIVLFLFAQRYFIRGLVTSGMKA